MKDYPSVAEYAEEFLRRWFAQVNFRTLRNITLRNRSVRLEDGPGGESVDCETVEDVIQNIRT